MGYYTTSENTRIYFQDGAKNNAPNAKVASELLSGLLGEPVGIIVNDSNGIANDAAEYLYGRLPAKVVLNEYTYRVLNAQNDATMVITHGAGNCDAYDALEAGYLFDQQYQNLTFLSVGSSVESRKLQSVLGKNGARYLKQINHGFDVATYPKKAVLFAIGLFPISIGIGIWIGLEVATRMGVCTGSLDMFAAGCLGGYIAVVLNGISELLLLSYCMKNYHPFAQYFQNQKLQQQVLDWQKQQPPSNLKK